jgi:hypothetical protein
VLAGADHGFAELVGDVAGNGNDAVHPQIHHAWRHEKSPPASDETAQDAADKPQQDHLQRCSQVDVDKMHCEQFVHTPSRTLLNR